MILPQWCHKSIPDPSSTLALSSGSQQDWPAFIVMLHSQITNGSVLLSSSFSRWYLCAVLTKYRKCHSDLGIMRSFCAESTSFLWASLPSPTPINQDLGGCQYSSCISESVSNSWTQRLCYSCFVQTSCRTLKAHMRSNQFSCTYFHLFSSTSAF